MQKVQETGGKSMLGSTLHTWASLIQMKRHTSLDEPPDYPFFRGYKKAGRCGW